MNYAEAAYFDDVPCQHVADWLENQRLRRRLELCQRVNRERRGRGR